MNICLKPSPSFGKALRMKKRSPMGETPSDRLFVPFSMEMRL